jgi:hypothetical protein
MASGSNGSCAVSSCVDEESKQHAQDWFMASLRALPTYAPSFTALGICYDSATPPDAERALKCYQKAFELDATEADAAQRLAIGYANDDEWAQVRLIATRVMEGEGGVEGVAGGEAMSEKARFAPKNGWAWKALGATEMVSGCRVRTHSRCVIDQWLIPFSTTRITLVPRKLSKSLFVLTTMTSPLGPSLVNHMSSRANTSQVSKLLTTSSTSNLQTGWQCTTWQIFILNLVLST